MLHQEANCKKFLLIYILQLFSYGTYAIHVQLVAPHYVNYHTDVTLLCNHSVPDNNLLKVEFLKDDSKILEYIRDRNPPFNKVLDKNFEYSPDGKTITLKKVGFWASGFYWCEVSTVTPIYEKESKHVKLEVIVPQTDDPEITFDKRIYFVGEYLKANCSSTPAQPAPYLRWLINGKEVELRHINHYPHQHHKNNLISANLQLKIQISEADVIENGQLQLSCEATIPDFHRHKHYADFKSSSVTVQVMTTRVTSSSSPKRLIYNLTLILLTYALGASQRMIPL